jgi:hypothetical protein
VPASPPSGRQWIEPGIGAASQACSGSAASIAASSSVQSIVWSSRSIENGRSRGIARSVSGKAIFCWKVL